MIALGWSIVELLLTLDRTKFGDDLESFFWSDNNGGVGLELFLNCEDAFKDNYSLDSSFN